VFFSGTDKKGKRVMRKDVHKKITGPLNDGYFMLPMVVCITQN
jgi:hypothetical protein